MKSPLLVAVGTIATLVILSGSFAPTVAEAESAPAMFGRYSTPDSAQFVQVAAPAVALVAAVTADEPETAVETAAALVVAEQPVLVEVNAAPTSASSAPAPTSVVETPAPTPAPIAADPIPDLYMFDPEAPNEGRPNGAGGWDPEPQG